MINLVLHKFKDKKPENNSVIYIFDIGEINNGFGIESHQVDIFWFEYDKDDMFTGSQVVFNNEEFLENSVDEDGDVYHYKKVYIADGFELSDEEIWCYQKDLCKIINDNNETIT